MKNNELLNQYLDFINYNKNYSKVTYMHYKIILQEYISFLQDQDILNTTVLDFENFFIVEKKELSNVSRNNYITVIKGFYKYLDSNYPIQLNLSKIKYVKEDYEIKRPFTIKEIKKIFLATTNDEISFIIEFLYYSGIRVSELINIKLEDIDVESLTIKIHGKGNKQRLIYIIDSFKKELIFRKNKNNTHLVEFNQKPIRRQKINTWMKEFEQENNFNFKIHPHKFRRSLATHLLEKDMDIRQIQHYLGHDTISSTEKYIKLTQDKLKSRVMNAFKK